MKLGNPNKKIKNNEFNFQQTTGLLFPVVQLFEVG